MLPRPGLPRFDYVRARDRDQVVRLLQEQGDSLRLMMGGTDLLVRMRDGTLAPRTVVDVKHLPGMREIRLDPQTGLSLGAAVSMNQVAGHAGVRAQYAVLAEAAGSVASYQVRNRATLGGNLCNASPAADTAPAVLVLDGRIVLYGPAGEREVPADQFFLGPGKSARRPHEFVTEVHIPPPAAGAAGKYLKLGRNRAGDLAVVGVAVLGVPDASVASGHRFRIALASVAPVPLRAHDAEDFLATRPPDDAAFAVAADRAMHESVPIDDVRAGAAYRRSMVRNLTMRALQEVWAALQAGKRS